MSMKIMHAALLSALLGFTLPAYSQKAQNTPDDSPTGVAECDNYISNIRACIRSKIPEPDRTSAEQALEDAIEKQKELWATVSDKAVLAKACKEVSDQARTQLAPIGCKF